MHMCVCMHACIRAYIQTYIHTYIHTSIYIHAFTHTCMHTYRHTTVKAQTKNTVCSATKPATMKTINSSNTWFPWEINKHTNTNVATTAHSKHIDITASALSKHVMVMVQADVNKVEQKCRERALTSLIMTSRCMHSCMSIPGCYCVRHVNTANCVLSST
jgi:hypothetical protein